MGVIMATLTIRNLDPVIVQKLKRRAAEHNRSMEAEVRILLREQVTGGGLANDWLDAVAELQGAEFSLPPRSTPREISFS
jgi:plasmid stability protein